MTSSDFWARVSGGDVSECWIYAGPTLRGYGRFRHRYAHRVAYEELIARIPDGLFLDHLCRTRECVNPWHMEPVTTAVNNSRRVHGMSLRTHCPAGHPYDVENTYLDSRGKRNCRACARDRARHRYQHNPEFRERDKQRSREYQRNNATSTKEHISNGR